MEAQKCGDWMALEELGGGGQGKVYRAVNVGELCLPGGTAVAGRIHDLLRELTKTVYSSNEPNKMVTEDKLAMSILHYHKRFGALKKLHEAEDIEKALRRMEREVQAAKELKHDNLAKLLECNFDEHWLVWQFYERGDVDKPEHRKEYEGNALASLEAVRGVVEALAHMHGQTPRLVHRDVKTKNILVADDGRLVLADLGLVFIEDAELSRITETSESVGSKDWLPRWAKGKKLDAEMIGPRFDVVGAVKVLYCLASGKPRLPDTYGYMKEDEEYDLKQKYGGDPAMARIDELVLEVDVDRQDDCPSDATELLGKMDEAIADIRAMRSSVDVRGPRKCRACGVGTHESQGVDPKKPGGPSHDNMLGTFGVRPESILGTFRIEECGNCGHIDLFHFGKVHRLTGEGERPFAWRDQKQD